jgi:radical SAM protein with 4Fe4S-binding SPASM domain
MCAIQFREDGPPNGPPAFMAWEQFERILDGCGEATELHLQGLGEPLMHPRFFDMVRAATARGLIVSTNSNLTLLTERRAEQLLECGLRRLHVSIDGARAETYEAIRHGAHFDRVVTNARRLLEMRRVRQRHPLEVEMVAVLMRQNLHELPGLVVVASELGMDRLSVQHLAHDFEEEALPARYAPMRAFVDQQTVVGMDRATVDAAFAAARREAEARGLPLRLPNLTPRATATRGRRCNWPWHGAYISFDGRAMPCCMVGTPDRATLGSVAERPLLDVWEGEAYRDFRGRLDSSDPPEICRSCSVYRGTF